jgi:hypothetical protein
MNMPSLFVLVLTVSLAEVRVTVAPITPKSVLSFTIPVLRHQAGGKKHGQAKKGSFPESLNRHVGAKKGLQLFGRDLVEKIHLYVWLICVFF